MPNQDERENQSGNAEGAWEPSDNSGANSLADNKKTQSITQKPKKNYRVTNYGFRYIGLIVEILVFVAVCVYSFFAYQQWQAMSKQARTMKAQLTEMKRSTDTAKESADTAKRSIEFARESAHLDQRAWVAITSIAGVPEVGKTLTISVTVKNTGKTFAKNVIVRQVAEIIPKAQEPNFAAEENEAMFWGINSKSIISPSEQPVIHTFVLPYRNLERGEIEAIQSGDEMIFVHGKISYEDVFGCQHWTTFCNRFNPRQNEYDVYETHNEAGDNHCP